MYQNGKKIRSINNCIRNLWQEYCCASGSLSISPMLYFLMAGIAIMGIWIGNSVALSQSVNVWYSIIANVSYSLFASVVYACITDIAATRRMRKKHELQYQILLQPLMSFVEQFYVDLVADNRRLEAHEIGKRDFGEWAEFYAKHYDDGIYDTDIIGDLVYQLEQIQVETKRLRKTALLRFDHDKMGAFERSGFRNLNSVAGKIIELLNNENIDDAMQLVSTQFKHAVKKVYAAAPFDKKVDCNEEL